MRPGSYQPSLADRQQAAGPARPGTPLPLSIVIVNWNTRDLLLRCLDTVIDAEPGASRRVSPREIVVVDNASTDSSAQAVRERFPDVRLVENRENVGFARANNQAIPLTTQPYVLLLNPDTEVVPGALEALVDFMEKHPESGAAGSRLVGEAGDLQVSCSPAPTLTRELWRLLHLDAIRPWASYPMHGWSLSAPREVDVVQGASLVLRRAALDETGLLDEEYFIYSEEVDLCYRLRRRGWRIFWVPESVVVHLGGQSTRQVAAAMFLRLYQGKILYFRKHHGRWAARLYKLILAIAALPRVALGPIVCLRSREAAHYRAIAGRYRRLLAALPAF